MEIPIKNVTKDLILKYQVEDKVGMLNFKRKLTRWRPDPIKLYDYDKVQDRAWFPVTASKVGVLKNKIDTSKFNFCKKPYPAQMEALDAIIEEADLNGCCVGQLPTGFGKSIILSYLIEHYQVKTMVILPNNTLLKQVKDTLEEFGLNVSVYGGGKKELGDVTVMSAKGLSLFTDEELHNLGFDLVIIDECHNAIAKGVRRALVHLNPARQIGLSATPWHGNFGTEEMSLFFGRILEFGETPIQPAFRIINYKNLPYKNTIKNWVDFREELDDDKKRLATQRKYVIDMMLEHDTVLVLYDRIEKHVIKQYEELKKGTRLNVVMLHGKMKKKDREAAIQSLKDDGGIMIASAAIAAEGFDVPRIEAVALMFPNKFNRKVIQMTGRALRKYGDKKVGYVYDWQESALPHQAKARNKIYRTDFNQKI